MHKALTLHCLDLECGGTIGCRPKDSPATPSIPQSGKLGRSRYALPLLQACYGRGASHIASLFPFPHSLSNLRMKFASAEKDKTQAGSESGIVGCVLPPSHQGIPVFKRCLFGALSLFLEMCHGNVQSVRALQRFPPCRVSVPIESSAFWM